MTASSGGQVHLWPEGQTIVGSLCREVPRYSGQPSVSTVVFAWGVNEDRQLGLDGKDNMPSPKVVESFLGIRLAGRTFYRNPLVTGSRNTLAIDAAGQVWSFGWNDRGTLGLGHRMPVQKPQRLTALNGIRIVQVAVNGWHCLALSETGQVFAWGGNEYQQCGVGVETRDILLPTPCLPKLKVRQVACGGMHSLALTEEGTVWTWGEPWGEFHMVVDRSPRPVPGAEGMACIAAGAFHNMALSYSGQVFTWGTNDYGQLGNGHTTYNTEPSPVLDLDDIQVADIAAGGWHSLALTVDGELFAWGRGEYGRLGIGDPTGSSKLRPHKVRALEGHRIVQVAAGGTHTMAVSSEGRLWSWGRASFGRLGLAGLNGKDDQYSPVELALPGGSNRWFVASISCGGRHSMCLALPLHDPLLGGSSEASESGLMSEADVENGSEASLAYRDSMAGGVAGGVAGGDYASPAPNDRPSPAPRVTRRLTQNGQQVPTLGVDIIGGPGRSLAGASPSTSASTTPQPPLRTRGSFGTLGADGATPSPAATGFSGIPTNTRAVGGPPLPPVAPPAPAEVAAASRAAAAGNVAADGLARERDQAAVLVMPPAPLGAADGPVARPATVAAASAQLYNWGAGAVAAAAADTAAQAADCTAPIAAAAQGSAPAAATQLQPAAATQVESMPLPPIPPTPRETATAAATPAASAAAAAAVAAAAGIARSDSAALSTASVQGSVLTAAYSSGNLPAAAEAAAAAAGPAGSAFAAGPGVSHTPVGLSTTPSSELGCLPSIEVNLSISRQQTLDNMSMDSASVSSAAAALPVSAAAAAGAGEGVVDATGVAVPRSRSGGARVAAVAAARMNSGALGSPRHSSARRPSFSPSRRESGASRSGSPHATAAMSADAAAHALEAARSAALGWAPAGSNAMEGMDESYMGVGSVGERDTEEMNDSSIGPPRGVGALVTWPDQRAPDMHTLVDMTMEDEEYMEQRKAAARARRRAARLEASRSRNPSVESRPGSTSRNEHMLEGDSESPVSADEGAEDYEDMGAGALASAATARIPYQGAKLEHPGLPAIATGRNTPLTRPMSPSHAAITNYRTGMLPGAAPATAHLQATLSSGTVSPMRMAGSPHEAALSNAAVEVAARLAASVVGSPRNHNMPSNLSFSDILTVGSMPGPRSASPLMGGPAPTTYRAMSATVLPATSPRGSAATSAGGAPPAAQILPPQLKTARSSGGGGSRPLSGRSGADSPRTGAGGGKRRGGAPSVPGTPQRAATAQADIWTSLDDSVPTAVVAASAPPSVDVPVLPGTLSDEVHDALLASLGKPLAS